jgi:hypothetical protein
MFTLFSKWWIPFLFFTLGEEAFFMQQHQKEIFYCVDKCFPYRDFYQGGKQIIEEIERTVLQMVTKDLSLGLGPTK